MFKIFYTRGTGWFRLAYRGTEVVQERGLGFRVAIVWYGYSAFATDRKSFPQVAVNACSDRFYCIYLPFQKIMTQRNIVALEARGRERYLLVFFLFVCLLLSALCSVLFPLIFAEPFLFTDFFSVLPSGTNSYSLFSSAEKNG